MPATHLARKIVFLLLLNEASGRNDRRGNIFSENSGKRSVRIWALGARVPGTLGGTERGEEGERRRRKRIRRVGGEEVCPLIGIDLESVFFSS